MRASGMDRKILWCIGMNDAHNHTADEAVFFSN